LRRTPPYQARRRQRRERGVGVGVAQVRAQGELDAGRGEVLGEHLGGAGGVGAHQHRYPAVLVAGAQQAGGDLRQRGVEHRHVIGGRVRAAFPVRSSSATGSPPPPTPRSAGPWSTNPSSGEPEPFFQVRLACSFSDSPRFA
jgi:hypothetical protein